MGALRKLCTRPGALGGVPCGQAPVLLLRVRRRRGHIGGLRGHRGKLRIVSGPEPRTVGHIAPLRQLQALPGHTGAPRNTGQGNAGAPVDEGMQV